MAKEYQADRPVNNAIYNELGARWYDASDDPVALLRAESKLRNPWVAGAINGAFGAHRCPVLDIGCGAGFLSNYLARLDYPVTGLDNSPVCAMDFLEHVEEPERVIAEVARVLRPNGLFFFHTFNRNWLAWLVVIKGVEWFVHNTPRDMHVLRLLLKPDEVTRMCNDRELEVVELLGSRPALGLPFARMLATGSVPDDFEFRFSTSTRLAFTGYARKLRLG